MHEKLITTVLTLDSDELDSQNISIRRDARILRYVIFIITEESTTVTVQVCN